MLSCVNILMSLSHGDHAGGNKDLLKQFPGSPVVGGKDCAHVTKTPTHKSTFNIGSITLTALHTPCHTQDSICYYAVDGDQKAVFTGDTLFVAGCGRFFEGNAKEMNKALNEVLAALPDDTKVYPGHEYTKSNIRFGKSVLDSEPVQKLSAFCEENDRTEGKFTIGDEKVITAILAGRSSTDVLSEPQRVHETGRPHNPESNRQDRPCRSHGEATGDEEQLQVDHLVRLPSSSPCFSH